MSQASDFQPAWLLHSRPYRETSALAWLLTLEDGRLNAVVRGVRTKKSRYRALLQPFTPLMIRVSGNHDLKTLIGLEATAAPHWLQGEALVCGLYANELLSRLLLTSQACPVLFRDYSLLLQLLNDKQQREPALRRFELSLLEHLGFPLVFTDTQGQTLSANTCYRWLPEQGFLAVNALAEPSQNIYSGASLLAIADDAWQEQLTRQTAKSLTRLLLNPLLGSKPLQSRQLFIKMKKSSLK